MYYSFKRDYSYVNSLYFTEIKEVVNRIKTDQTKNKYLIFVSSKKDGLELQKEITDSVFITSDSKNSEKLNEISKKYELKDVKVSDIPEGITPLKFDSAEELDKYLESLKANKKEEKPLIIKNTNNNFQVNNNFQALASSYPTGNQSQKLSSFVTGSWNMSVTYTYDPNMSPKRFVSCSNIYGRKIEAKQQQAKVR
jgi:hypothetical protein